MKKILQGVMILLVFFPLCTYAAESETRISQEILDDSAEYYGDFFEKGLKSLDEESVFETLFQKKPKEFLLQLIHGKLELSVSSLLQSIFRILFQEVYHGMKLLGCILILSILSSYLTGLQESFGKEGVGMVAFYVCYIVIAGIASTAFYQTAECVGQSVSQIALFMKMVVPIVITTLITCGAIVSATVFEPVLITIVEIAVSLIQGVMLPLVMISAGMNIVNHLSERFKTQKLVKFMNQCIKWGLSVMLTIFVSVTGLQSIASGSADALTLKLSKFATSNLIPVVGGILAETVETVMNCSVLIKNSVGILGILCLIVLAVFPLLKVWGMLILFRLTAAVCEPVSDNRMIVCLTELANAISVLFSILAAVTVMFIIVLTIVLNAGNTALMLGR